MPTRSISASSYFRDIGDTKPDPDLLEMAETLIEKKTSEFDAKEFENRYIDALKKLIAEKQKKKGKRVIQDDEPDRIPKGTNVIDLMAALKKSLGDDKKPAAKRRPRESPPASLRLAERPRRPLPSVRQAVAGAKPWRASRKLDIETYNRKRDFSKTKEPQGPQAQGQGRQLRRPEA